MKKYVTLGVFLVGVLVFSGCSSGVAGGTRLKTSPVFGVVQVDGEPVAGVTVECYPEAGASEKKSPIITAADVHGKFSFTTYQFGDGLPEGAYRLAFKWKPITAGGQDKLNGAYAEPAESKYKVTVVAGQPNDLGTIELSTKGPGR